MDLKQIQELVKIFTKSGISELSFREGDFGITMKAGGSQQQMSMQQMQQPMMQYNTGAQQDPSVGRSESKETPAETAAAQAKSDKEFTFRSPMIGTFYRKPGPDKDVFVKVGDTIQKGDVLCIIEAMKLFNEIEYDGDSGKIVKILVDESSPVEYDQPLFIIEKA